VTTADDPRKSIFPGIAFQVPEGAGVIYLGTLSISVPARKDFMGNKGIPKAKDAGVSGRVEKRLMLWSRALEIQPPYQSSTLLLILNTLPWPLLMHR
jgi:hypothetical protein